MSLMINIDVPDIDAGTRFYTQAFGLTVGRRFGTGFVELLGWPAKLYLLTQSPRHHGRRRQPPPL
jgi:catechol 2,3-dioxygenase-like lactoylglutathione lyase family enzyme